MMNVRTLLLTLNTTTVLSRSPLAPLFPPRHVCLCLADTRSLKHTAPSRSAVTLISILHFCSRVFVLFKSGGKQDGRQEAGRMGGRSSGQSNFSTDQMSCSSRSVHNQEEKLFLSVALNHTMRLHLRSSTLLMQTSPSVINFAATQVVQQSDGFAQQLVKGFSQLNLWDSSS